jgi:hypothetical protein
VKSVPFHRNYFLDGLVVRRNLVESVRENNLLAHWRRALEAGWPERILKEGMALLDRYQRHLGEPARPC